MKAFVVVALLVASVAGQRWDMDRMSTGLTKSAHRVQDLLMKENLKELFLQEGQDMPTWGMNHVEKLTLEEMIQTPLFREYYEIPMFRQFWEEYPTIFHKYVQSVLFQQFWTVPAFMEYFRQPALFYKYIVPQVEVIAENIRQHGEVYNTLNFNKYNKFNQFVSNNKYELPMTHRIQYPTMYENMNVNNVNYKFLLDKIYKELNFGKVGGEITGTMTEVHAYPTGRIEEHTFGKVQDPITGEERITVGDAKLVDEKIVPVQTLDFPVEKKMNNYYNYESEMMKEAILKKIYLNKIFGKKVYPEQTFDFDMMNKYNKYNTMDKYTMDKYNMDKYNMAKFNKFEYEPTMTMSRFNKFDEMNTMDKYSTMSPIVARMIFGNKMNKMNQINEFPYGGLYNKYNNQMNKMDLINEYQTEKMIKDFQTEKMINGQVYPFMTKDTKMFNKFNMFNTEKTMDMEIPTMMTEKYHHIPLTYGKPLIGSGLNEFKIEKELKEMKDMKNLIHHQF